jgi:hypothetical protein
MKLLKLISLLTVIIIALGQGCARSPFSSGEATDSASLAPNQQDEVIPADPSTLSVNDPVAIGGQQQPSTPINNTMALYHKAMLTGDQYLQTIFTLTGVPNDAGAAAVRTNYLASAGNFAVETDVKLITSPMLLSVGNLAGQVCQLAITREQGQAAAGRRMFVNINFGVGPQNNLTAFDQAYLKMAQLFWGRSPDATEIQLGKDLVNGIINQAAAADRTAASTTTDVALAMCAGLLSTVEVLTF